MNIIESIKKALSGKIRSIAESAGKTAGIAPSNEPAPEYQAKTKHYNGPTISDNIKSFQEDALNALSKAAADYNANPPRMEDKLGNTVGEQGTPTNEGPVRDAYLKPGFSQAWEEGGVGDAVNRVFTPSGNAGLPVIGDNGMLLDVENAKTADTRSGMDQLSKVASDFAEGTKPARDIPQAADGGMTMEQVQDLTDDGKKRAKQRVTDDEKQAIYDQMYSNGYIAEHESNEAGDKDQAMFEQGLRSAGMDEDQIAQAARPKDLVVMDQDEWKRRDLLRGAGQDPDQFVGPVDTNVATTIIDDGTRFKENLTSAYMTGDQYKKYVEAGLGGRDIEDIDENKVYNKLDENEQYGFSYYRPDMTTEVTMAAESAPYAVNKFWTGLASIRPENNMVKVNDKDVDLKEFYKDGQEYFDTVVTEAFDDPGRWHDAALIEIGQDEMGEGSQAFKAAGGYRVRFEDGSIMEYPEATAFRYVDLPQYTDEPITIQLSDGNVIIFDDRNDFDQNFEQVGGFVSAKPGEMPAMYADFEDMVLSNGTSISFAEANQILDEEYEPGDYGWANIAKPKSELNEFWTEEGGLDFSDFVPNMIDIALSSTPYFDFRTSLPLGLSKAAISAHGLDPDTMDYEDGSMSKIKDKVDPEVYMSNIAGNLAMPFTEIGLGRIGGPGMKMPRKSLERKIGERAWMPSADWIMGTVGEGIEEVVANPVESLRSQGISGLYGNEVLDENGEPVYDDSGHVIRETDTSFADRLRNFALDAPNAFIGGAALGGMFGLPELPYTLSKTKALKEKNRNLKESGAGIYRKPRPKAVVEAMPEDIARKYE